MAEEPPRKKRLVEDDDSEAVESLTQMESLTQEEPITAETSVPDSTAQPPTKKPRSASSTPNSSSADRRVSFAPNVQSQGSQPVSSTPAPEERKPRLVITKMVLNNFKSYAGRQVIGPFQKVRFFFSYFASGLTPCHIVFQCQYGSIYIERIQFSN
ncbi:hypothetical protein BJV82DRAFT_351766 [Fennellomyces sp. T-0311]|nr:hypothetical protein BJV82DRAFT_351766 [Fennellomyces sp. T-0311]